jgi:osmoprotectant transport system substrate-binding protein
MSYKRGDTMFLRRALALALVAVLAVAAAGCGSDNKSKTSSSAAPSGQPGAGKPAVTLGSKNFPEEVLLGELYAQALRAKGYKVNVKANIGATEVIDKALTSGKIDGYPEYTGIGLSAIAGDSKTPSSAQDAYNKFKAFEEKRGFTLLNMTPFVDTNTIIVKPDYAAGHQLKSIADFKNLRPGSVRLAGPPEFATRAEGLPGLKKAYGVTFKFKPLAIGLQYGALDNGDVQTSTVFTTDGQLQGNKYTELSDPKHVFGYQNVAPVLSKKVVSAQGPEFSQTLNAVSALLSTEAMRRMNAAVVLDKQAPAAVASSFLKANNVK